MSIIVTISAEKLSDEMPFFSGRIVTSVACGNFSASMALESEMNNKWVRRDNGHYSNTTMLCIEQLHDLFSRTQTNVTKIREKIYSWVMENGVVFGDTISAEFSAD